VYDIFSLVQYVCLMLEPMQAYCEPQKEACLTRSNTLAYLRLEKKLNSSLVRLFSFTENKIFTFFQKMLFYQNYELIFSCTIIFLQKCLRAPVLTYFSFIVNNNAYADYFHVLFYFKKLSKNNKRYSLFLSLSQ
jgi:hypothetical protein